MYKQDRQTQAGPKDITTTVGLSARPAVTVTLVEDEQRLVSPRFLRLNQELSNQSLSLVNFAFLIKSSLQISSSNQSSLLSMLSQYLFCAAATPMIDPAAYSVPAISPFVTRSARCLRPLFLSKLRQVRAMRQETLFCDSLRGMTLIVHGSRQHDKR